jgi:hypothetical protein
VHGSERGPGVQAAVPFGIEFLPGVCERGPIQADTQQLLADSESPEKVVDASIEDMTSAFERLRAIFGPRASGGAGRMLLQTPQTARPFSVGVQHGMVLDAFNAVVSSHSQLRWEVTYCGTTAALGKATIAVQTYDGHGVSNNARPRTAEDGAERWNFCAPQ